MSFATMNGITQTRALQGGMGGTTRMARPQAASWGAPMAPQPQQGASAGPVDDAQFHNQFPQPKGGMLGTTSQGGAHQYLTGPSASGVVSGAPGPQLAQPQAGPAFDPNDPNNAALAGYMRG